MVLSDGVSQPGAPPSPSGIKPKDIDGERMNETTDRKPSEEQLMVGHDLISIAGVFR